MSIRLQMGKTVVLYMDGGVWAVLDQLSDPRDGELRLTKLIADSFYVD